MRGIDRRAEAGTSIGLDARLTLILMPWLSSLALAGLTPILSTISEHFADTPGSATVVRLLVTVVGGAMVIGAPAAGFLAERVGERGILLWSLALYAIFGTAGAVLDDPWLILGSRVILGLAMGGVSVMAATIITTQVEPGQRDRWLGYYTMCGTFGAFIIIPAAGIIGAYDWRAVFLLHLLAVPLLLLAWLLIPSRGHLPSHLEPEPLGGGGFPLGLILLSIACGVVSTTVPVYLPFHLTEIGESNPQRIATALTVTAIFSGVVSFFYGNIRKRFGPMEIFALSFLIYAIGIAVVVLAESFAIVLVGMAIGGGGLGLIAPNLFGAAAAATRPERRARTIGLVRAGFFGGPLLAQIPLEPIAGVYGPSGSLAALAAFSGVMMAVILFMRRPVLSN